MGDSSTMKRNEEGFTLIEILLAMGIFMVGVMAIMAVFPKATSDILKSENDNITAACADSIMGALSGGVRQYAGNKANPGGLRPEDVVWFTYALEDSAQDFFILPISSTTGDETWYPNSTGGIPTDASPLSTGSVRNSFLLDLCAV